MPEGATFIGQPIWGSLGYALPAVLGTCLAATERRHLLLRFLDAMDASEHAVVHCVRNEAELEWALQKATDSPKLHLIELILPRLDAPEPLAHFARKAAEFDFPQLFEEEIDQVS